MTPATRRALVALVAGHHLYVYTHRNGRAKGEHPYQEGNAVGHVTLNALLDNGLVQIVDARNPTEEDTDRMKGNKYAHSTTWDWETKSHIYRYNPCFWSRVHEYTISEKGRQELGL